MDDSGHIASVLSFKVPLSIAPKSKIVSQQGIADALALFTYLPVKRVS